jgi:hypothetical protein
LRPPWLHIRLDKKKLRNGSRSMNSRKSLNTIMISYTPKKSDKTITSLHLFCVRLWIWISNVICPCPFFLREVVTRFVDIGEIAYYHYLYFLFIKKTQRALSGNLQSIDYNGHKIYYNEQCHLKIH